LTEQEWNAPPQAASLTVSTIEEAAALAGVAPKQLVAISPRWYNLLWSYVNKAKL